MRSYAFHEAGHVVVARYLGFKVESSSIEPQVSPLWATKTVRLKDYFDEDALMFGRLERKDKKTLERKDYRLFYNILVQKVAGSVAVELAGGFRHTELGVHFEEDRAFVLNILNYLKKDVADIKFTQIQRIAEKILKYHWAEVETLAQRLLYEKTVYFNNPSDKTE
ncbi:MAG: hypothetical protein K9M94_15110 [Spirochaetia bacterium]|nr:hypothetical protein [Spirochaetia bacterium]